MGASFSLLLQIDWELTARTFSPKAQSSYWVQFILGIVAGLSLSTVLSISSLAPGAEAEASPAHFRNAALALIGGFSSSVVQRLIRRLIEAMETMLLTDIQRQLSGGESPEAIRVSLAQVSQGLFTNDMPTLPMGIDLTPSATDTRAGETRDVVEAEGSPQPPAARSVSSA